jgi:SAM-dependent methyltransferase
MRSLLDAVMRRRAEQLAPLLLPYLPHQGRILDLGAGTGHNGMALARRIPVQMVNLDVADMHVVGPHPVLFDGSRLPFADDSFAAVLLLFVLQYSPDSIQLLREVRRICAGPVLVLQSTYEGYLAQAALRLNDLLWGPLAFAVAQATQFIDTPSCPLYARALAQRPALLRCFAAAGLHAELVVSRSWPLVQVRRDIFVLNRIASKR